MLCKQSPLCLLLHVQNDLKLLKEKAKRKQAIIVRQEEELQAREQVLASDEREMRALSQALEAAKMEVCVLGSPRP
jgi:spindle assembly abnormal protein 6